MYVSSLQKEDNHSPTQDGVLTKVTVMSLSRSLKNSSITRNVNIVISARSQAPRHTKNFEGGPSAEPKRSHLSREIQPAMSYGSEPLLHLASYGLNSLIRSSKTPLGSRSPPISKLAFSYRICTRVSSRSIATRRSLAYSSMMTMPPTTRRSIPEEGSLHQRTSV